MKIGKYFVQNHLIWMMTVTIIIVIGGLQGSIAILVLAACVLFIFPLFVDCSHVPERMRK